MKTKDAGMGKTTGFVLALLLCMVPAAIAEGPENKYEGAGESAKKILNESLGSVGQAVVIKVGKKSFHVQIPGDKYSPAGDETEASLAEIKKQVLEAVDKAKKGKKEAQNISVSVSVAVPAKVKN